MHAVTDDDNEQSRSETEDDAATESPYASEGYSDEIDDYLAEIASPTLSTREADTLTPTAHLTGMRKNAKRKSWISVASSHSQLQPRARTSVAQGPRNLVADPQFLAIRDHSRTLLGRRAMNQARYLSVMTISLDIGPMMMMNSSWPSQSSRWKAHQRMKT